MVPRLTLYCSYYINRSIFYNADGQFINSFHVVCWRFYVGKHCLSVRNDHQPHVKTRCPFCECSRSENYMPLQDDRVGVPLRFTLLTEDFFHAEGCLRHIFDAQVNKEFKERVQFREFRGECVSGETLLLHHPS